MEEGGTYRTRAHSGNFFFMSEKLFSDQVRFFLGLFFLPLLKG
jgi:hypothetical protein